jgi:hypothetical protein
MKTIQLKKQPQKQISNVICLGNGVRLTATSQRQQAFLLTYASQFLTKMLVNLNVTFADCFAEYRQIWFVTVNSQRGAKCSYYHVERKIKLNLDACGQVMDKFSGTHGSATDPYFSFVDLKKCAWYLHEAAQAMAAFHKRRNHTSGLYACTMMADRCQAISNRLDSFGQTEADKQREAEHLAQIEKATEALKLRAARQKEREEKKKQAPR